MENTGQIPMQLETVGRQCMGRVEELVRTHHVGQVQGIKSRDLTYAIFGQYNHNLERALQKAISTINENGGLICSDTVHGYWWAASLNDGLPAAARRVDRALNQLRNARVLKDNLRRHFGGQMEMKQ